MPLTGSLNSQTEWLLFDGPHGNYIKRVQQSLTEQGLYSGEIDGIWGPETEAAILRLQVELQLEESGTVNPQTANALGLRSQASKD